MSSTVRANSSFFASMSTSFRSEVSTGTATQQQTASASASWKAARWQRDSFECGQASHQPSPIKEGGCLPSTQPQQDLDLSFMSQALQLVGGVLDMVSNYLKNSATDPCAPSQPKCETPASPGGAPSAPGNTLPTSPGNTLPTSPGNCEPALPKNCLPSAPPKCEPAPKDCAPTSPKNCPPSPGAQSGKTWDVFFDSKQGTKTQQRSPIVLDLNGNGRPDITGSNIKGNGKLEGQTVKGFDLDPTARQWQYKSENRRPGSGAPNLPAGTTMKVFDANGNLVGERAATNASGKGKKGSKDFGLASGQRAEFHDKDGRLIGELKADGKKGKQMYFWGNKNENEWTKPWDANGGDGILAWDQDGDNKITSGKELFGEFDVDGKKKFSNGYEKLAQHFDKNRDGVVEGEELKGLKIWEDRNGDGVTQDGELVELASRGVKSLNVKFNQEDMSSSYGK